MLLISRVSAQKTYYEVLSVNEGATYDEIRAGYRSAILNAHPDKSQANPDLPVSSGKQGKFLSAQKAWEVLRDPKSRADYDKQLQTSWQSPENVAYEIEVDEMTIKSTDHATELLYPCSYRHHDGQMRLRSTTLSRRCVAGSGSVQELIDGFDQEAAAAVMARLVSFKTEAEVFAQLLQAPQEEADTVIKERFPVPRLVVCDQYGSQARFLLAKLNPSVTYNSDNLPPPGGMSYSQMM